MSGSSDIQHTATIGWTRPVMKQKVRLFRQWSPRLLVVSLLLSLVVGCASGSLAISRSEVRILLDVLQMNHWSNPPTLPLTSEFSENMISPPAAW